VSDRPTVGVIDAERLDPAGAVADAADACSRRGFMALAGAGALALGIPVAASAKDAAANDTAILNFALVLEYLQAAFYTEAERLNALTGHAAATARQLGAVERAHATALQQALGDAADARPFFDFQGATEDDDLFVQTAVAFEDLGAAAYKNQLTRISTPGYLSAAASIHSVEARHAAWIRYVAGVAPAVDALDDPISDADARALVARTGFVRPRPATVARRAPAFTG
jgi:hypothetical protein